MASLSPATSAVPLFPPVPPNNPGLYPYPGHPYHYPPVNQFPGGIYPRPPAPFHVQPLGPRPPPGWNAVPSAFYPPRPQGIRLQRHRGRGRGRGATRSPAHAQFVCKACDKEYAREENYNTHLKSHQKCSQCDFSAVSKVLKEHELIHMLPDMLKFSSPEEIQQWREERRKNFPTAENVARKKKLVEEKKARGETAQLPLHRYIRQIVGDDDNGRRGGKRGRGRGRWGRRGKWPRKSPGEERCVDVSHLEEEHVANGPMASHVSDHGKSDDTVSEGKDCHDNTDAVSGEKGCHGDGAVSEGKGSLGNSDSGASDGLLEAILADAVGQHGHQLEDENTSLREGEERPSVGTSSEGERESVGVRGKERPSVGISSEGEERQSVGVERPSVGIRGKERLPVGTSSEGEERPSVGTSRDGVSKTTGRKRKHNHGAGCQERKFKSPKLEHIPARKPTLLEKLLASEVQKEQNVLLQCVRYVVKTGFLGHRKVEGAHNELPTAPRVWGAITDTAEHSAEEGHDSTQIRS